MPCGISGNLTIVAASILIALVFSVPSKAEFPPLWSTYSNSPRSIALGGCGVTVISAETPIYSPGGLGIYSLDHILAVQLPNNTDHANSWYRHNWYRTWGVMAAPSYPIKKRDSSSQWKLSLGLAFSHISYEEPLGIYATVVGYDQVNCYSGALGVEYRKFVRVGIGYTFKRTSSHLPFATRKTYAGPLTQVMASSTARDEGVVGQLNLHSLIPKGLYLGHAKKTLLHLEIIPSYGYVKSNIKEPVAAFDTASYNPLVRTTAVGGSFFTAIKVNEASVFSFFWCQETSNAGAWDEIKPHGIELGIGGILFLRQGSDQYWYGYGNKGTGIGFSLRGVTTWLATFSVINRIHGPIGEFVRRLDVTFDYAKRKMVERNLSLFPGSQTEYYKVMVSFAN
jgi:hypothetical protein